MGIFIFTHLSKSITQEEWKNVYEESLILVDKFNFCTNVKKSINNIEVICLEKTKDTILDKRWIIFKNNNRHGWITIGDLDSRRTAEDQYMLQNHVGEYGYDKDAGDPLLSKLCEISKISDKDEKKYNDQICTIFGNKTQGEPYHLGILAIACLLESRLKGKVFTEGDITRGQVAKAVEIANDFLKKPIDIPDRCDLKKFYERINKLDITNIQKIHLFISYYLGKKDKEFGDFVSHNFDEVTIHGYFKDVFLNNYYGTSYCTDSLKLYFTISNSIEKLCELINFSEENKDKTKENCLKFIKEILDSKLHIKEKDCYDMLTIDQDDTMPYSIATLMMHFMFNSARNKKIDLFIPIEEIEAQLCSGLNKYISTEDIKSYISSYIENEKNNEKEKEKIIYKKDMNAEEMKNAVSLDACDTFKNLMDIKRKEYTDIHQKYDITDADDLVYYEKGNSIYTEIEICLKKLYLFCTQEINSPDHDKLTQLNTKEKCKYIAQHNTYFYITDLDYKNIFSNIKNEKYEFIRYYSLLMVKLNSDMISCCVKALLINDDLWDYIADQSKGLSYKDFKKE